MSEQERTEQATPKKRREARERGEIARSRDVVAAASLVAATAFLAFTSRSTTEFALDYLRESASRGFVVNASEFDFCAAFAKVATLVLGKLSGLFLLVVLGSVIGNILQTGFLFLPKKCLPDFKNLNPGKNLKGMFSFSGLGRALYGLLKFSIFGILVALALKRDGETIANISSGSAAQIAEFFGRFIFRLAYQFCAALVLLSAADYAFRRWKYERDLRMTQQEIRDELKEESGNPQAKGLRAASRRTLMESIPSIAAPPNVRATSSYRRESGGGAGEKGAKKGLRN